jgi:RHS repeat-associated protein
VTTWLFEENSFAPIGKLKAEAKYNIVSDYLGTPFEMYDQSGGRVWQGELDSFGAIQNFKGDSKTDCPFRYQGQYEDAETGLYYNRFRYYSPEEGVYLSQDPIGILGGITPYSYVKDTNSLLDVYGLSVCKMSAADKAKLKTIYSDAGITNPHDHHIVREMAPKSWDAVHQKYITDSQDIISKAGIDLNTDIRNFTRAANGGGAHTKKAAKYVYEQLTAPGAVVEDVLSQLGKSMNAGTFF